MKEQNDQQVEIIKMVERALTVLDLLRTSKERLGVNEIAKRCDLSPSTAFRILKTLEVSGWVFQLSDDRYIPADVPSESINVADEATYTCIGPTPLVF